MADNHENLNMFSTSIGKFFAAMGTGTGFLVGFWKYWDHFWSEVLFKILDACIITAFTTLVGLVLSYFGLMILRKIFPPKELKV